MWCHSCERSYNRNKYADTRADRIRDQFKLQAKRVAILNELKSGPCMDCGGKFPPECMDFDHRDGNDKFKPISLMRSYSLERYMEEINKCDLVCANCHRIRTFSRKRNEQRG